MNEPTKVLETETKYYPLLGIVKYASLGCKLYASCDHYFDIHRLQAHNEVDLKIKKVSCRFKIKDFPKIKSGRNTFAFELLLPSVNILSTSFNDA